MNSESVSDSRPVEEIYRLGDQPPLGVIPEKMHAFCVRQERFGEPKEVANTIVKAIKDKKPLPRYIVGNDASMFLEAKKSKTDIEFENYLKKELYDE